MTTTDAISVRTLGEIEKLLGRGPRRCSNTLSMTATREEGGGEIRILIANDKRSICHNLGVDYNTRQCRGITDQPSGSTAMPISTDRLRRYIRTATQELGGEATQVQ